MGIFDFFRKITKPDKVEEIVTEKLAFSDIKGWVEKKTKENELKEKETLFVVGGKIKDFIKAIREKIVLLESFDVGVKKESDKIKNIVMDSRVEYIESLEPNPFSPYAVTKLQAEQYLLDNFENKSWILRFAPVYSTEFLININRRTKIGNKFYKIGSGEKKLSLCNIDNIKEAVEGIIDGRVPTGVYNISDPISYTYNNLLNHQDASSVVRIPALVIRLLYMVGKITNNVFLKENTVKLITDNIFPSDKIRSYIDLTATINDVKPVND